MSVSTNDSKLLKASDGIVNLKANGKIPKDIFSYVWKYSRYEQLELLATTFLSFPILYLLLEIPKTIINDALSSEEFPRSILSEHCCVDGHLTGLNSCGRLDDKKTPLIGGV